VELICPDCHTPLESADGQSARCPAHGGEFQILFTRHFTPPEVALPPVIPVAGCVQHPESTVVQFCEKCGAGMCASCDSPQPDGSHFCPACAQPQYTPLRLQARAPEPVHAAPPPLPFNVPAGVRCVQHPHLAAAEKCGACGAYMCHTCTFDLPTGAKLCPACATSTSSAFDSKKKNLLIGSYAFALWCTIILILISFGVFRNMGSTREGRMALGFLLLLALVAPSLAGLALGVSTVERRRRASIATWIAIVWNGLFVLRHLFYVLLGFFRHLE
jgi:hypothetical protein